MDRVQIDQEISVLERELVETRGILDDCVNAAARLSQSAAEERAKNSQAGRGFIGGLLGSKYRGAVRQSAAASNASISREVAKKRGEILEIKHVAKERERGIKVRLSDLKKQIKILEKNNSHNNEKSSALKNVDLLKKIKEAYDMGILTDAEYEAKRSVLVADIGKEIGVSAS